MRFGYRQADKFQIIFEQRSPEFPVIEEGKTAVVDFTENRKFKILNFRRKKAENRPFAGEKDRARFDIFFSDKNNQ